MEQNYLQNAEGLQSDCLQAPAPLSLYIHIPFCLQKCRYCDFLSGPSSAETREAYIQALLREISLSGKSRAGLREEERSWPAAPGLPVEGSPLKGSALQADSAAPGLPVEDRQRQTPEVDTIFFGGGTPSVLEADQLARIMAALHRHFRIREEAEISLEMNPGTADAGKLRDLKAMGINRLSIGVQSMHDRELRLLGRIHTAQEAGEAYVLARKAGFSNINLDLMSALPGQSFRDWAETLEKAVCWEPEHLSAYSLIIEPGTPFASLQENGKLPPLPDEETDREMYHYTRAFLAENGYRRYEISNYAKPGRACRHNCGYWTGHDWLGLGIGAASCVGGVRFINTSSLEKYLKRMTMERDSQPEASEISIEGDSLPGAPEKSTSGFLKGSLREIREEVRHLSLEDQMEEFMFLGLRMTAGVRESVFLERFGTPMQKIYGEVIRKHLAQGVLRRTESGICLTERGIDVSNYVLADYLLS